MNKIAAAALLFLAATVSGPAAELSLALKAGAFFPSQHAFRTVYGTGYPLGLDVRLDFAGPFGFSAGYESVGLKGSAVPLDGGEDILPLKFDARSLRLAASLSILSARPVFRVSAGAVRSSFKESWTTIPGFDFEDAVWGPFASLAVETPLTGRIGAMVAFRYDSLVSGSGGSLDKNINLGGFQAAAGLILRIF